MGTKYYVGIDLGTTNTLVCYVKGGKTRNIKFDGKDVLPSVLYVDTENNDEITIGEEAYRLGDLKPENRIISSKTYMGTDKKYIFQSKIKGEISMTPTFVATEILKKAKARFVDKLRLKDDDEVCAVITTPAAFSFSQNEETINAAEAAGLTVLGTRPEPVAAAIACIKDIGDKNATIFVVDIGGGTYDTAVIDIEPDKAPNMISSEGDRRLGGDDIDRAVYEYLKKEFILQSGIDITTLDSSGLEELEYNKIKSTLHGRAREAKVALTQCDEYSVECKNLYTAGGESIGFKKLVKLSKFNEICASIYEKIEKRLDDSVREFTSKTGRDISSVTHLVLVGGTCYIPSIVELIENKIGLKSVYCADKTTAIAQGAAIIANSWTNLGADIGGVLSQSMGIMVEGGELSKIIHKGREYPCEGYAIYSTTYDNQQSVDIVIYAAAPDKENVKDINQHEYYGYFTFDNIEPAPKGVPNIKVKFSFDNSQKLTVTAKNMKTGYEKQLTVSKGAVMENRNSGKSFSIELLIDVSGSMRGAPLDDAKVACRKMVNEIVDFSSNEVGITAFGSEPTDICEITSDPEKLIESIPLMKSRGTTCMSKGILRSAMKLVDSGKYSKIIFLMTDGSPDGGDHPEKVAAELKEKGIKLAVIFIGSPMLRGYDIAQNIAAENTKSGEKPLFYTSNDMSELGSIFKRVYADITLADE